MICGQQLSLSHKTGSSSDIQLVREFCDHIRYAFACPPLGACIHTDFRLAALYFVGGVRVTFSTGIAAGGNLAYWTSYVVTMVFTFITAAVIAEVCSASPSAGSIYLWAAEAGGPRFGRLLGFIVAWWSTTAWTTFCASMLRIYSPKTCMMVI
jgi:hypothetical protein